MKRIATGTSALINRNWSRFCKLPTIATTAASSSSFNSSNSVISITYRNNRHLSLSTMEQCTPISGTGEGQTLTITLPDDFHHHFRQGDRVKTVLSHAVNRFGRCIAMPNLKPPVTTVDKASEYRQHIMSNLPKESALAETFMPLMTLYLTDNTKPEEIYKAKESGFVHAVKYYPAGATTNSDFGVSDVKKCKAAIKAMEECNMILCIHSEVSRMDVDIFDRERVFIDEVIDPLVDDFPNLKIVMEHVSTKDAIDYVAGLKKGNVRATITAHHLLYNRNAMLVGGIKPHYYCLPILKREKHRKALLEAATSGNPKFFAGTDSAPHATTDKESACGCAGVYTAHAAVEFYAEAFDSVGKLDKLEGFLSHYGADFYGLPRNTTKIVLQKKSWEVPSTFEFGEATVTPLRASDLVNWSIVEYKKEE